MSSENSHQGKAAGIVSVHGSALSGPVTHSGNRARRPRNHRIALLIAISIGTAHLIGSILFSGCASPGQDHRFSEKEWSRSTRIDWSQPTVQLDHPPAPKPAPQNSSTSPPPENY